MTLGWVCVFVSCIWRESSPPWKSLKTTSSTYTLPCRERSFLYPPRTETDQIYHQRSQMKRAACLKHSPSSTALSLSLWRDLCVNLTQVSVVPMQKIPKVNKTPFFVYFSIRSNVRPHREIFWPTDNTNTVVKQQGWFISSGLWNVPWETKMALLTDSTVNDILQHHLDVWMCVSANATDEFGS